MKKMTEDVVNEICKVCMEVLDNADMFGIFKNRVFKIDIEDSDFYQYEETVLIRDLDFSIEAESFLSDIDYFGDIMTENMIGFVFSVENDTIRMYLCTDFQPELSFTFKKTFDDDLFD